MASPSKKKPADCPFLEELRLIHRRRCNCRLDRRAEIWLRHGGDRIEINPGNFHLSVARWLANAGLVEGARVDDVAAALYCLGVTNSNNLLQKVRQGKVDSHGIGRDGRRNGKGKSGA